MKIIRSLEISANLPASAYVGHVALHFLPIHSDIQGGLMNNYYCIRKCGTVPILVHLMHTQPRTEANHALCTDDRIMQPISDAAGTSLQSCKPSRIQRSPSDRSHLVELH